MVDIETEVPSCGSRAVFRTEDNGAGGHGAATSMPDTERGAFP